MIGISKGVGKYRQRIEKKGKTLPRYRATDGAAVRQDSKEKKKSTLTEESRQATEEDREERAASLLSPCEWKKAAFLFEKQMKVKPLGNSD